MTKELMQYDSERDDKVVRLPIDSHIVNHPIGRRLYLTGDEQNGLSAEYLETLKRDGKTSVVVSRTTDYSKIDKIALYNTLRAMEIRNPSSSRIREEFQLNADDMGLLVGRDFETNQPVFYENRVLQSDQRFKDHLDKKLGEVLPEAGYRPVLRATWLGTPDTYDGIDTSAGRLVGVTRQ